MSFSSRDAGGAGKPLGKQEYHDEVLKMLVKSAPGPRSLTPSEQSEHAQSIKDEWLAAVEDSHTEGVTKKDLKALAKDDPPQSLVKKFPKIAELFDEFSEFMGFDEDF